MNYKCSVIAMISLAVTSQFAFAAEPEIINLNINTSTRMKMTWDVTRLAISNPEIATVVQMPDSYREFLIISHKEGSTTLYVWLANKKVKEYLINVSPEDVGQAKMIEQSIGLPNVHVKKVGERLLLTGTVRNQYERNYAVQVARLYIGSGSKSSLSVSSGVEMKLETSNANSNSTDDLNTAKIESEGNVIDLLQVLYPTQIRLEAQIIEINSDNTKDLGIEYGQSSSGGTFYFGQSYGSSRTAFNNNPAKWFNQHFDSINATIHTLVTNGKARVLSRPNITTMSGEQATIQIGGQIPYTVRGNDGWSTEFKDYGIILQCKPIVDAKNRITSMIHTEVSNISGQSVDNQPIIATRRADSVINLNSGSTIVIGGLMDSSESKSISKIPLLGDIPILGEFFKYNSKRRDKRELVILVTPYIVEDSEVSQTSMTKNMQDWYDKGRQEQSDMNKVDVNEELPPPTKNQINDKDNKSNVKNKD